MNYGQLRKKERAIRESRRRVRNLKKRKTEVLIPVRTDPKTIFWVRESKLLAYKWKNYFIDFDTVKKYVQDYKNFACL